MANRAGLVLSIFLAGMIFLAIPDAQGTSSFLGLSPPRGTSVSQGNSVAQGSSSVQGDSPLQERSTVQGNFGIRGSLTHQEISSLQGSSEYLHSSSGSLEILDNHNLNHISTKTVLGIQPGCYEETTMGKGYIRIETKGQKQYATHFISRRDGNRVINTTQYLGTPIDLENGIFHSRDRGTFCYDIENGFANVPQQLLDKINSSNNSLIMPFNTNIRSSLEFGSAWLVDEMIKQTGYYTVLNNIIPDETDTLLAYILFRLFNKQEPSCNAFSWYRGSYANILYPSAVLDSPSISNFLLKLGNNDVLHNFFHRHLDYLANTGILKFKSSGYILIDSTDVKNVIKMPQTALIKRKGSLKKSTKLIYAIDRISNIPLIFRCLDGNIVDVSTLINTVALLKSYGFNIKHGIVDAGYYSRNNISELYNNKIPFIIRLISNTTLYQNLLEKYSKNICISKNSLFQDDRLLYGKKEKVNIFGHTGYAYVLVDFDKKNQRTYKYEFRKHYGQKKANIEDESDNFGTFIILSSTNIPIKEVLPLYYTRQKIEQVFDVSKNNTSLQPPRVHYFERYKGHVMINFISTTLYLMLNKLLEKSKYNASRALYEMNRLTINMENGKPYSIEERNKDANVIIQTLNFKLPVV
ncbi:MAG: transposase [Deltaproteobacteria bacterium]|jgi:hypothetical protein|nr:transposase [Deltaproteobacteria bacterium]